MDKFVGGFILLVIREADQVVVSSYAFRSRPQAERAQKALRAGARSSALAGLRFPIVEPKAASTMDLDTLAEDVAQALAGY